MTNSFWLLIPNFLQGIKQSKSLCIFHDIWYTSAMVLMQHVTSKCTEVICYISECFTFWYPKPPPWSAQTDLWRKLLSTLRPRQNGCPFSIRHCQINFILNENCIILIQSKLQFVSKGPFNNSPALVKKMCWWWTVGQILTIFICIYASLEHNAAMARLTSIILIISIVIIIIIIHFIVILIIITGFIMLVWSRNNSTMEDKW